MGVCYKLTFIAENLLLSVFQLVMSPILTSFVMIELVMYCITSLEMRFVPKTWFNSS